MSTEGRAPGGPWVASDRPVPRLVVRPLRAFLDTEISGGLVLLVATIVALAWANSPWAGGYDALWGTELSIRLGPLAIAEDLRHWVNDGLMTLFFFVVGLEIKRELVRGELMERRRAALPVVAALGGMIGPALIYAAINAGGAGSAGWGIPMATDIAFALGVLALLGPRLPQSLRVFMLTLAIVDDIGAITVIALFYSGGIDVAWLAAACALLGIVVGMRVVGIWWVPAYAGVGALVWLATFESGVHATISGVALGLVTPAHPLSDIGRVLHLPWDSDVPPGPGDVRAANVRAHATLPVAERLASALHPWTSFLVVPLFALANAGIALGLDELRAAPSSPVTIGVVLGLVVGKLVGVTGAAWLAVRAGVARKHETLTWQHVFGGAALAGIGFTVAIFIASLAFRDPVLVADAKVGILAASVVASLLGAAILFRARGSPEADAEAS